jgi:hypothetical protein
VAEETSPTITLVDLQNIVKIIDAAAERGAFKGGELTAVGTVRDKVTTFLAAVSPPAAPAEGQAEEAPAAPAAKAPAKKSRAKK